MNVRRQKYFAECMCAYGMARQRERERESMCAMFRAGQQAPATNRVFDCSTSASVAGSRHVKQFNSSTAKHSRSDIDTEVTHLLTKWGAEDDVLLRHVLEGLKLEELEALNTSGYLPDKFNAWKSCADTGLEMFGTSYGKLLASFCC